MRKIFCLLFFFTCAKALLSQMRLPQYPDTLFTTYYYQRLTHFKTLPQTKGDVVFLGNSIADGGEWSELFNDPKIKNRGISGDVSAGVLNRLDEVAQRKPAKVFLLIGVNDLARNVSPDSVVKNILLIASYFKQESPSTQLFVQSVLPVNDAFGKFAGHTAKGELIKQVNQKLAMNAVRYRYDFIDLYSSFCNEKGKLKKELTNDGLHLLGKGYLLWKHLVYPHVYGLQKQASLLPLPQKLQWKKGYFPLHECRSIFINNEAVRNEAIWLQRELEKKGLAVAFRKEKRVEGEKAIVLQLGKVSSPMQKDEAYQLDVTENEVVLTANTRQGIFNGLQTLLQLARDGVLLDACSITDWPAFAWRGYMIDVGRNYVSMDLLKQQIDAMAAYKLNVFHFHPTEDIAWRIESILYPQVTAPDNMLRNKGQYYSEEEIKELIAYCKERYITFVPEIDMPGHSAAFGRAMKTDMQSDSGLLIVKNILKEFCTTYDVQYVHIGADEVKITNQKFIPEVTAYIESFGKGVIGWQPGGKFSNSTIRQLWMDDNAHRSSQAGIRIIDSRHLYLNHMDPLEAVVTIFNRRFGDKEKGDSSLLGATLCTWNDRRAANDFDILRMNPVYPGMLAFAERTWRGGGQSGWTANLSNDDANAFTEFEARLLDQKEIYFKDKAFPYAKQTGVQWQLYGPYDNEGDAGKKFSPEFSSTQKEWKFYKDVVGGTVVLRHWWYPLIKGAVDSPKENSTFYAFTRVWSDEDCENNFWIGFNNLSRSTATDSPPAGAWDNKGSELWVNRKQISPPHWQHGNAKGNPETPLVDEGYEYRAPTKIFLKKGWNNVLLKCPVESFKGKDWQNPVKWMFTFLRVN